MLVKSLKKIGVMDHHLYLWGSPSLRIGGELESINTLNNLRRPTN